MNKILCKNELPTGTIIVTAQLQNGKDNSKFDQDFVNFLRSKVEFIQVYNVNQVTDFFHPWGLQHYDGRNYI